MKKIFLYFSISLATVIMGLFFAVFMAETFLNAQPLAEMVVVGIVMYLCFIVVFCTCLILRKLDYLA